MSVSGRDARPGVDSPSLRVRPARARTCVAAAGALALLPRTREGTASRGWLLAWNTFGFLDLVSAITVGLLFSESAIGVLHTATSNTTLMVTFPVSLIPTFFVPLFLLVHALTFRRIARLERGSHAVSGGIQ